MKRWKGHRAVRACGTKTETGPAELIPFRDFSRQEKSGVNLCYFFLAFFLAFFLPAFLARFLAITETPEMFLALSEIRHGI
ncbi:MAG TPA: hypothetical protein VG711_01010 [Phycisphaerales bacterium]|nr:hypothetical protein [Phycisphaerales bacterium]